MIQAKPRRIPQPIRMQVVWQILERAKDCGDQFVIDACRRLIVANRLGWRKHHKSADWTLVRELMT